MNPTAAVSGRAVYPWTGFFADTTQAIRGERLDDVRMMQKKATHPEDVRLGVRRNQPFIAFLDQYDIRREAADSACARQGEATTCRIDREMESDGGSS